MFSRPTDQNIASDGLQRGFAVVELAIVLVTIGSIIAAVLKGQELIVSARLKSTISDIDAIRSAINSALRPATTYRLKLASARRPASLRPTAVAPVGGG